MNHFSEQDRLSPPGQTYMSPPTNMATRGKSKKHKITNTNFQKPVCKSFTENAMWCNNIISQRSSSNTNSFHFACNRNTSSNFGKSNSYVLIWSFNSLQKLTTNSLEVLELICVMAGITAGNCRESIFEISSKLQLRIL